MREKEDRVTVEVELDADLVDQLSVLLKPLGLSPDDYFQMCINYMANPANRERVEAMFAKWRTQ